MYTKAGDKGFTALAGGKRVPKDDRRIETYGTVDELNASLGVCRATKLPKKLDLLVKDLQLQLLTIGSVLANPASAKVGRTLTFDAAKETIALEQTIDELDNVLPELKNFLIPGGSQAAAQFHIARTICRRAERMVVRLNRKEPVDPALIGYFNRLSSLLFVLARYANHKEGVVEEKWQ